MEAGVSRRAAAFAHHDRHRLLQGVQRRQRPPGRGPGPPAGRVGDPRGDLRPGDLLAATAAKSSRRSFPDALRGARRGRSAGRASKPWQPATRRRLWSHHHQPGVATEPGGGSSPDMLVAAADEASNAPSGRQESGGGRGGRRWRGNRRLPSRALRSGSAPGGAPARGSPVGSTASLTLRYAPPLLRARGVLRCARGDPRAANESPVPRVESRSSSRSPSPPEGGECWGEGGRPLETTTSVPSRAIVSAA